MVYGTRSGYITNGICSHKLVHELHELIHELHELIHELHELIHELHKVHEVVQEYFIQWNEL
jgi:hypothetical protein